MSQHDWTFQPEQKKVAARGLTKCSTCGSTDTEETAYGYICHECVRRHDHGNHHEENAPVAPREMTLRDQMNETEKMLYACKELFDLMLGPVPAPPLSNAEKLPILGELENLAARIKALTYGLHQRVADLERRL